MGEPLKVYLDSNDYSRLSEPSLDPRLLEVKKQLLRIRDDGGSGRMPLRR
jgi:hypothetical protein